MSQPLREELLEHRTVETISEWLTKGRYYNDAKHSYIPARSLLAALEDAGLEIVEKRRG